MKILELPVDTIINCSCGCTFVFDPDDVKIREVWSEQHHVRWLDVYCPFCTQVHLIKRIDYEKGDENEC